MLCCYVKFPEGHSSPRSGPKLLKVVGRPWQPEHSPEKSWDFWLFIPHSYHRCWSIPPNVMWCNTQMSSCHRKLQLICCAYIIILRRRNMQLWTLLKLSEHSPIMSPGIPEKKKNIPIQRCQMHLACTLPCGEVPVRVPWCSISLAKPKQFHGISSLITSCNAQ